MNNLKEKLVTMEEKYGNMKACARKVTKILNLVLKAFNNGTFHDTISAYMTSYRWRGMFIEPIPDAFEALTRHVTSELPEGCILENVAVSNNERTDTMCYIPWATIENEGLDDAIIGMNQ